MTGSEIRKLILDGGVKLWQVAEQWGVSDSNFSRRLRRPFSEEETERICRIVAEIKERNV